MLVEEQIQARRARAKEAIKKVASRPRPGPYGDYRVESTSGAVYRIAMRGPGLFDNYCACPDFARNTLGTCKHIESLLERLRKRHRRALERRGYKRARASVSLEYGETIEVRLRLPDKASPELESLAARYFDPSGLLPRERYGEFEQALEQLRRLDVAAVVYSDAIEYVDRINEFDGGLALESRELRKLERGKLPLHGLLKSPLFPYQMRGALFAARRGRTVLADDMGLGKTIQAIAAAALIRKQHGIERVLVIAPASVKYQWQSEIQKFSDLSVQVIDGPKENRRQLYAEPAFFNLLNYELVVRDLEQIQALGADMIILDEAQRIRNWATVTARAVKQLKSRYALVLTGTPLENKLEELYSVVEFVDGRRLGPAFRFLHDHVVKTDSGKITGYRDLNRIKRQLEPILLRRTRKEVLPELPERTDQIFHVEMTEAQAVPYWEQSDILAKLVAKWNRQKWISEIDLRRISCCLQNMRMLCNSTFLYDKETRVSPKLDEFREIIRELVIEENRKVVVFSEYARMTALAGEELAKLKIGFVSLHGAVPTKKRQPLLKRFRGDPACKVFLSTDAGGVGINLQQASAIINFEPPWNPARLEQRIGRVHRLGQEKPVQVIHLLTRDSIEERVWETIRLKKALFSGVFDSATDEVDFTKLGKKSMLETLNDVVEPASKPAPKKAPPEKASPPASDGAAQMLEAASGLIEAGVRFLEALAPPGPGPGKESNDLVSSLIRKDPGTKRTTLAIPLPDSVDADRLANLAGGLLRAFQSR